ncbi:hypothetical protein ACINB_08270 [Acidovorax sp. NB1]|nr:hypothetical protein ACINB_08270 [Acidovorax sp. NB1]
MTHANEVLLPAHHHSAAMVTINSAAMATSHPPSVRKARCAWRGAEAWVGEEAPALKSEGWARGGVGLGGMEVAGLRS